jgi:branched-chain amino acid transport system substrate-binding protein
MPGPAQAKEVTFLDLTDLTGPVAGLALPGSVGLEDYIKDLNARGGVEGVKVKYVGVDTRYDVARGLSSFKRYRRDEEVLAINIVSTPFGKMLKEIIGKEKTVIMVPGDGEYQAHIGNFFLWGPAYQDAFSAAMDWIMADWKKKGKTGKPPVAHMSWDSPYGREPLRGGKEYAEKLGINLINPEFFPVGTPKHDVYLTRIEAAGAQYVYVGGVDPTQTNVMRDAAAMGLPKKIQFISDYWGPTALGISTHAEALESMVVVSFFLRGAEAQNHPLMKRLWTTYQKEPIEKMNEAYSLGLVWGMNFEAALKDAIKRVGANKLTREVVYDSYERIAGASREGISGPCAYGKDSRRGSQQVKFYQCVKGKIVPVTDWVKTPDAVGLHKW